jgi:hypothetical protein
MKSFDSGSFGRLARTMSSACRITGSATGTLLTRRWKAMRSSPDTGRFSSGLRSAVVLLMTSSSSP